MGRARYGPDLSLDLLTCDRTQSRGWALRLRRSTDEDLLRCAPTPAELESTDDVYDIEAITKASWTKHRSEDVWYIDMHYNGEGAHFFRRRQRSSRSDDAVTSR